VTLKSPDFKKDGAVNCREGYGQLSLVTLNHFDIAQYIDANIVHTTCLIGCRAAWLNNRASAAIYRCGHERKIL